MRPSRIVIPLLMIVLLEAPAVGQIAPRPRSPKAAAFLSILAPGLGELYAGGPRSGRFFLFTEATIWAGLALFEHLESARTQNFKSFAAFHTGLDADGKSETFIDDVVNFDSIYSRNARERFVAGEFAEFLPEIPENSWEWDSEDSRRQFRTLRTKATSARQKGLLFVGALIFNRFASSINAAHIARKTQPRLQMSLLPMPDGGAAARLFARF